MGRRKDDIKIIEHPGPQHVPYRRRPNMVRFLVLGGLIGLVVGSVLGALGEDVPGSSPLQAIIVMGATGALLFGFLGAVAYLIADRASTRS